MDSFIFKIHLSANIYSVLYLSFTEVMDLDEDMYNSKQELLEEFERRKRVQPELFKKLIV